MPAKQSTKAKEVNQPKETIDYTSPTPPPIAWIAGGSVKQQLEQMRTVCDAMWTDNWNFMKALQNQAQNLAFILNILEENCLIIKDTDANGHPCYSRPPPVE